MHADVNMPGRTIVHNIEFQIGKGSSWRSSPCHMRNRRARP